MKHFVTAWLIFPCVALVAAGSSFAQDPKHEDSSTKIVGSEYKNLAVALRDLNVFHNVQVKLEDDRWSNTPVNINSERIDIHAAIKAMLREYNYLLRREGARNWSLTIYGPAGNDDNQSEGTKEDSAQFGHNLTREANLHRGWIEVKSSLEGIREFIRDPKDEQRGSQEKVINEWIEQEGPDGILEVVRHPSSRSNSDVHATESSIRSKKKQDNWIVQEGPDGITEVIRHKVVEDTR